MSTGYRQKVLAEYEKKKTEKTLSLNLQHLTAASLRDECVIAFENWYKKKDEPTVRHLVGPRNNDADYLAALKLMEADKVKSLYNFLRGKAETTNEKNIELLAWLINYEPRPHQFSYEDACVAQPTKLKTTPAGSATILATPKKKFATIILVAVGVIIAGGLLFMIQKTTAGRQGDDTAIDTSKGCMFWSGDRYHQTPCRTHKGDTLIVGLNPEKLQHFFRIMQPDTITSNSLSKVWYVKINSNIEYYTADGFHPVHVERKLHPLTIYIIRKYIHH